MPEGPKIEGRGGVLGEGAASPLPTSLGLWGSASPPARGSEGAL